MRRAVTQSTRIYAPDVLAPGALLALRESAAHHLARVLRAAVGDQLVVFNGGVEFAATIARIDKHGVTVKLASGAPVDRETPLPCVLAQAISSGYLNADQDNLRHLLPMLFSCISLRKNRIFNWPKEIVHLIIPFDCEL